MVELPSEAISSWMFVCREFFLFLVAGSISLLVIALIKLLLYDSILASYMFLKTCPFLLCCPICCYITVHSIFLFLYFCGITCYFLDFSFCFFKSPLSVFGEPGQRFVYFFNLPQILLLLSFILYFYFFFFNFLSDLYYFFPILRLLLLFVFLLLILLGYRLCCIF